MARDEALLEGVGAGRSPATVRLYQWAEPTISLGYFQPFADLASLRPPAGDLPVVRRPTGGGAILHDQELTYSMVLPVSHPLIAGCPNCLYDAAHTAIVRAFSGLGIELRRAGVTDESGPRRGPFFCFARRHEYDLLLGDEKLAGSAQRRTRQAVLQHGSIVLRVRYPQQPAATLPHPIDAALVGRYFADALCADGRIQLSPGRWEPGELASAAELVRKYAGHEWTRRT